jgi:O-succinylbenzoic acid--CoA ligase
LGLKDPFGLAGGNGLLGTGASGVALIDADEPARPALTYADLAGLADRRAVDLCRQGLQSGQLVAVPERPAADLVLMQHALARAGAALLPVRPEIDSPGVRALLAETGAEWVWAGAAGGLIPVADAGDAPSSVTGPDAWDSPLALVVETSGSTGTPRAAMLAACTLRTSAGLSNRRLGLEPSDAWLCCLSLRHIGGLSIAYRCVLAGAAQVLRQGFEARAVVEDLARHAITHLSLVPPMLARLLDLDRPPPPSLRVVLVGGQHLSEPLARRAIERGWPIHVTYGMTETASQIATSGRLQAPPSRGCVGLPLAGQELDCPPCANGAAPLRIRGPLVMAGYASPTRVPGIGLADGWLATADLACLDPDGGLRILGRADEVLVTGGVNVHPARVESILLGAPGVRDLAVLGVSDPVWGQRLVAVYCGDISPADLDAWCRSRLRGPERPRGFRPVPEIPLLESGKRHRQRLLELAEGIWEPDR